MATAELRPAPPAADVARAALWFGIVGAPAAWTLHELVGSALAGGACHPGPALGQVLTPSTAWTLDLVLALVALAAGLAALWAAYRSWRRTTGPVRIRPGEASPGGLHEAAEGRARFMALAGILLSAVFTFTIALDALSLFLSPFCVGTA
jgi:hypothetical protein